MARSDPLTAETYEKRRAELTRHIAAAEADRDSIAYKEEMGEAGTSDLERARGALATLKDRAAGIDTAWREAQQAEQHAAEIAAAARRQAVVDQCNEDLAERERVVAEQVGLFEKLRELRARELELEGKIARTIGRRPTWPNEEFGLAAGHLYNAGFIVNHAIDMRQAGFKVKNERTLLDLVRLRNNDVRRVISDEECA